MSRRSRRASPTRCCSATGGVVASGPCDEVVTEQNLSATFGLPLVLRYEGGRFAPAARPVGTAAHARGRQATAG